MGGASDTVGIIGQNGIVSKMLESLNGLHGPPVKQPTGDIDKDSQILRERIYEYNRECFRKEFSYTYHKSQSRPEGSENLEEVIGKDGFASFPIQEVDNVRYVENRILKGATLAKVDKDKFKNDVVDFVENLIFSDDRGWQVDEFKGTYDKKLKVQGVVVWDVIDAPDPSGKNPSSQRLMVLNYVGVGWREK
ncbi:hypothetical protein S40293_11566 [Stachybotrys chartarum IBT 40293]|nr:hypothetical protein S40293_11566 [Stachybotrys chartarum IBT 40293]